LGVIPEALLSHHSENTKVSEVFTTSSYSNEENALPEVVFNHVKQDKDHQNIYVLDRGLQSTRTMTSFNKEHIRFIVRSKENRKHIELKNLLTEQTPTDLNNLILLKDSRVYLYTGKPINNKKGNIHYREELVETPFRLIVA